MSTTAAGAGGVPAGGVTAVPAVRLTGLRKSYGSVEAVAGVDLEIAEGEFFTMLGPSGSGKTTLLRLIAGFERPDAGRVELGGADVTRQPPYARDVNTVFQDYALFPHMSVLANVEYGLRVRRVPRPQRRQRAQAALEMVRLAGLGDRKPVQLSGGQRQRVALARAIVNEPQVLLLDEPLGALDLKLRQEMQLELKRIQREVGITFIYVTHDQEEALTMSDRIAVLNRGRIAQCDAPETIYRRPRSVFVASFFRGCNVLAVTDMVSAGGVVAYRLAGVTLRGVPLGDRVAGGAHIAIRAEDVAIGPDAAGADFQLTAVLETVTYRGTVLDYTLRLGDGQTLTAMMTRRMGLEPGATVPVGISRESVVPLED